MAKNPIRGVVVNGIKYEYTSTTDGLTIYKLEGNQKRTRVCFNAKLDGLVNPTTVQAYILQNKL
jgi:hypothetical protein